MKPFIQTVLFVFTVSALITLNSCKKSPFTGISKIEIENQGSFDFRNGLTVMADKKQKHNVRINSTPDGSQLYYAINGGEAVKRNDYWISVDSTVQYLNFYTSSNKSSTENYRIDFSFEASVPPLFTIDVYPNPTTDIINVNMEGDDRGLVNIEILNAKGQLVLATKEFKRNDTLKIQASLISFEAGIYFLKVSYGENNAVYRVAKQ